MTQWWRLLYDAGHKPVTRWVHSYNHHPDERMWAATDHLGRIVLWSESATWFLQEIDELPPSKQREREEALEAVVDAR